MTAERNEEDDPARLFRDRGEALLRSARRRLPTEQDAEDVVQDAMVAFFAAGRVLAVIQNPGGWLYTWVIRRCVDFAHRQQRQHATEPELEALVDDMLDAGESLERAEWVSAVAEAVKQLSEPLRFAFVENALEGRTFKEISKQSGIPMGTLMARKQKAIQEIKRELSARGLVLERSDRYVSE